jgi:hypothetical protein
MVRILMFSNSTGSFVTNFTVKNANSTNYFSEDHLQTGERNDRCAQSLLLPKIGEKAPPC